MKREEFKISCEYVISIEEPKIGSLLDEVVHAIKDIAEKHDGLIAGTSYISKF